MKTLFTFLLIACFLSLNAQTDAGISVTLQKQIVRVIPEQDNAGKQIIVHSNIKSTEKLSIVNRLDTKDWKRTFEIYNDADQLLLKIPASNQIAYSVSVKQLRASLKKGTHSLYTMAIPRDPSKAAVVRVRRILVCKIMVK